MMTKTNFRTRWQRALLAVGAFVSLAATVPTVEAQVDVVAREPAVYVTCDALSSVSFYEKGSQTKFAPGGFSKIATAVVALDWVEKTGTSMSQVAVVPLHPMGQQLRNPMGLVAGDRIKLRDAVYSALLGDDDVAAVTIASHVGRNLVMARRKAANPEEEFVQEMNYLAAMLGMKQTRFESPEGMLAVKKRDGRTTARDLALLAAYVMNKPSFRFYVTQRSRSISVDRVGGAKRFKVTNANRLVGRNGVDGVMANVRTGLGGAALVSAKKAPDVRESPETGESVVYLKRIVAVVVGSSDPLGVTPPMLERTWSEWETWHEGGRRTPAERIIRPAE
ncbi:D-alanyl-D-alanine carboxypeptidase family protein [Sulfuriroseicoccus oceanibius]|uniref:Peptidase S11 D-alanyl-D-alanine carboxypeptidase A N-terminal domain-containing protein n=1 Tax=Sulfuriroseicoccus oceanibius TaxID=2707525 RepID=A0A6B3LA03_9BACT|nr:hypothetical protein [Sulfuriroseicoccus oceanibius]QQL46092.1 hypothetical protein G3M56_005790 [Sulfuriroseicoccus oceanibius]